MCLSTLNPPVNERKSTQGHESDPVIHTLISTPSLFHRLNTVLASHCLIMPLCASDYLRLVKTYLPSWWIKKPLCQVGACQHTSVDERCCHYQCGVDTRTHMKTGMGTRVRVHPGLCHGTGMPSHDKGEKTALNELQRHGTSLFLSRNTAWVAMAEWTLLGVNRGAFAAAVSLEASFPRKGAYLVFIVDTQAVWGW